MIVFTYNSERDLYLKNKTLNNNIDYAFQNSLYESCSKIPPAAERKLPARFRSMTSALPSVRGAVCQGESLRPSAPSDSYLDESSTGKPNWKEYFGSILLYCCADIPTPEHCTL